ncbi:T9SS type A sorting domain-containing protein, partial [bacterium]|nr:T9SS type A sorting domain-containing protein [bacterium]
AVFAGYNHHEPPDSGVGRIVGLYGGGVGGFTLVGDRPNQALGGEVASAGDIDFDGLCEFAASMTFDPSGDSAGFVRIYGYDEDGDSISVDSTCWNPAPSEHSWFGYRMAGCEDITGDGMRNFAVADPMFDGGESSQGVVYIYNGWRDYWPIEAEFISPESGIISACPRQEFKIRLRHPSGLSGICIQISVLSIYDRQYTLDSTQLFFEDDSTLVYSPSEDWVTERWATVQLDSAYLPSTGESIDSSIINGCIIDLNPPRVIYIGDSTTISDRYPTFIWDIEDEYFNEVDTSALVAICGVDTVRPSVYLEFHSCNYLRAAVTLSDFGFRPSHGETITVCLDNIMDMPDTCGPNIAEPNCISRVFYRAWNTDLTFTSAGLSPTILTLGAEPSATDGYEPGLDIFMPPIPETHVDAAFSMDDPTHPWLNRLLRDLRNSDDDTLEWRIVTSGTGDASVEWIPEELPVGVWLMNGKLDMRAYPRWHFALGETLSIRFYTGPKVIIDYWPSAVSLWKLFSLPIYPETYNPEIIIGRRGSGFHTYSYSPEDLGYYIPERWPTGKGVWVLNEVWMCQPPNILGGWPIDTMWTQLSPGWNMIAAPFDTTPASDIATEPSGSVVSGTLYGFDMLSGAYFEPSELAPLSGYWVASSREAELFAPRDGSSSAMAKFAFSQAFGSPPPPPSLTGYGEEVKASLPEEFSISAYPNPFNSAVNISLSAGVGASDARSGQVGIEIFDISGRLVADLPVTNCGSPQFVPTPQIWTPEKSLGSGVYLVRAKIGDKEITKRIVYLK